MEGAERFCSQARHWLTQPIRSGAASTTNTDCRIWNAIPAERFIARISSDENQQRNQGEEAVEQVDADAALLQQGDLRRNELGGPRHRQIQPVPVAVFD